MYPVSQMEKLGLREAAAKNPGTPDEAGHGVSLRQLCDTGRYSGAGLCGCLQGAVPSAAQDSPGGPPQGSGGTSP